MATLTGPDAVLAAPLLVPREPKILALSFDSRAVAHRALDAALALQDEEAFAVHDAIVLGGDETGAHVVATMDPTAVAAAVPASLAGALVGTLVAGPIGLLVGGVIAGSGAALVAKLADIGIPSAALEKLRERVTPGQTVLALLVSERRAGSVATFAMRCGTIGTSTILPCP
jgi:uncharacterized membrane protein